MAERKSQLIGEAQYLMRLGERLDSACLFEQAGLLEEKLAAMASDAPDALEADVHWISAATCFARSGDVTRALRVVGEHPEGMDQELREYFASSAAKQLAAKKIMTAARDSGSLDRLDEAARSAVGHVLPMGVLWTMFRCAAEQGRHDDVPPLIQRLLVANPWDGAYWIVAIGLAQRSPDELALCCDELARTCPEDPRAHAALAFLLLELGRVVEAADACARGLATAVGSEEDAAGFAALYTAAALAFRRSGRLDEALKVSSRAADEQPADPYFRALHGYLLYRSGQVQQAEAELDRAIEMGDKSTWAASLGGALKLKRGDWSAALPLLGVAVEATSGRLRAMNLNNFGAALLEQGKDEDARTAFRAALEIAPELQQAQRNLHLVQPARPVAFELLDLAEDLEHASVRAFTTRPVQAGHLVQELAL